MKILAIDTSTEACSAALKIDNDVVSRYEIAPRMHAELILPMVDQLLLETEIELNQLDALAFGRGPGAFTGIRVATGVIQGLSFASELPVVAISSLATLAQAVATEHAVTIPAFDARMGEVYCGIYETQSNGLAKLMGEEQVIDPNDFQYGLDTPCYGLGTGWASYAEQLSQGIKNQLLTGYSADCYPNAEHMLPLACDAVLNDQTLAAKDAIPVYLRNRVTA